MVLNEKFYFKDFLYLVETGNENFAECICLFLKQVFTELQQSPSSWSSSLFPSTPSSLSSSLLSPSLPSSLI